MSNYITASRGEVNGAKHLHHQISACASDRRAEKVTQVPIYLPHASQYLAGVPLSCLAYWSKLEYSYQIFLLVEQWPIPRGYGIFVISSVVLVVSYKTHNFTFKILVISLFKFMLSSLLPNTSEATLVLTARRYRVDSNAAVEQHRFDKKKYD